MNINLETILGSKLHTAVEVTGLLIPANSLGEHLRRFAEPALFHTNGFEPFDVSKAGSLTRVRVGDRYFAITTDHQLRINRYDFNQLCIHNSSTSSFATSHSAIFQNNREQGTDLDAVLFEFTDTVRSRSLPSHSWYRLDQELSIGRLPEPQIIFAIGYPGHINTIDFDVSSYEAAPYGVGGEQSTPYLPNRLAFRPQPSLEFDPFGMSGGPVFGVQLLDLKPKVFFAGIITNATRSLFHFLSRQQIAKLIVKAMD